MPHTGNVVFELFVMFTGGKLLAEVFERLRQPAVVGELVAGMLLGPTVLGFIHPDEVTRGLAEIGAIFLLFTVGLETKPRDLLAVGKTASLVAVLGILVPFILGYAYVKILDYGTAEAVFVGAALVATSVGITARILTEVGALATRPARVILTAAVIDDILAMIVLAVVSSLSNRGVNYLQLVLVAFEAIGFSALVVIFGPRVVGRLRPTIKNLRIQNAAFVLSLIFCLGLAVASIHVGMAAIIGAFLAGLALAEHSGEWGVKENTHPLYEFLAPLFFVVLGTRVDLRTISHPGVPVMLSVVTLLAIMGKLIGCGLASARLGVKDALCIGVGMVPRGEVGMIVAAAGLQLNVLSETMYSVVLLMCALTTLFAPPVLRRMLLPLQPAMK